MARSLQLNWRLLCKAVSLFNSNYGKATYQEPPCDPGEEKYYIEYLKEEKTPPVIFKFLNKWGRMGRRHRYTESAIQEGLDATRSTISRLTGRNFETTNLTEIEGSIESGFKSLLKATGGSHVAAAKMLHFLLPYLAPIWDNTIRIAYGCGYPQKDETQEAKAYLKFALRLRRELDECLNSYAIDHKLSDLNKATRQLRNELYTNAGKSIVKIIDEYNFMKYTKGRNELWNDP